VLIAFPADVSRLFWDTNPATLDLEQHRDYILERVMARGGWEAMRWLRSTYSQPVLANFLERKGRARLAPRELAYWSLIAGIPCEPVRGGARPSWAGP
jgi:hypothetical protein